MGLEANIFLSVWTSLHLLRVRMNVYIFFLSFCLYLMLPGMDISRLWIVKYLEVVLNCMLNFLVCCSCYHLHDPIPIRFHSPFTCGLLSAWVVCCWCMGVKERETEVSWYLQVEIEDPYMWQSKKTVAVSLIWAVDGWIFIVGMFWTNFLLLCSLLLL